MNDQPRHVSPPQSKSPVRIIVGSRSSSHTVNRVVPARAGGRPPVFSAANNVMVPAKSLPSDGATWMHDQPRLDRPDAAAQSATGLACLGAAPIGVQAGEIAVNDPPSVVLGDIPAVGEYIHNSPDVLGSGGTRPRLGERSVGLCQHPIAWQSVVRPFSVLSMDGLMLNYMPAARASSMHAGEPVYQCRIAGTCASRRRSMTSRSAPHEWTLTNLRRSDGSASRRSNTLICARLDSRPCDEKSRPTSPT